MKIIEKSAAIVHFNLDSYYFEKYSEVRPTHGTKFLWTSAENNTLIWTYMHSFALAARGSESDFLQCLQQMKLQCEIEDIERDVDELIEIKKELDQSMKSFLENNILTFSEHLQYTLAEPEFYEACRPDDISAIEKAFDISYNTKTAAQIEHEKKMMRSVPFFDRPDPSGKRRPLGMNETRTTTVVLKPPYPPSFPSSE